MEPQKTGADNASICGEADFGDEFRPLTSDNPCKIIRLVCKALLAAYSGFEGR